MHRQSSPSANLSHPADLAHLTSCAIRAELCTNDWEEQAEVAGTSGKDPMTLPIHSLWEEKLNVNRPDLMVTCEQSELI